MVIRCALSLVLVTTILGPTAHFMQHYLSDNSYDEREPFLMTEDSSYSWGDDISCSSYEEFEEIVNEIDPSDFGAFKDFLSQCVRSINDPLEQTKATILLQSLCHGYDDDTFFNNFLSKEHFDSLILKILYEQLSIEKISTTFNMEEEDIKIIISELIDSIIDVNNNTEMLEHLPLLTQENIASWKPISISSEALNDLVEIIKNQNFDKAIETNLIDTAIELYTSNPFNKLYHSTRIKRPTLFTMVCITTPVIIILLCFTLFVIFIVNRENMINNEEIRCRDFHSKEFQYERFFPCNIIDKIKDFCTIPDFNWGNCRRCTNNCDPIENPENWNIPPCTYSTHNSCNYSKAILQNFTDCARSFFDTFRPTTDDFIVTTCEESNLTLSISSFY